MTQAEARTRGIQSAGYISSSRVRRDLDPKLIFQYEPSNVLSTQNPSSAFIAAISFKMLSATPAVRVTG